jgi:hypothetical protein
MSFKVLRKRQAWQKAKGQKRSMETVCSALRIAALLLINKQKRPNEMKILFFLPNIILGTNKRISKLLCFGLPLVNARCCLFLHYSSVV